MPRILSAMALKRKKRQHGLRIKRPDFQVIVENILKLREKGFFLLSVPSAEEYASILYHVEQTCIETPYELDFDGTIEEAVENADCDSFICHVHWIEKAENLHYDDVWLVVFSLFEAYYDEEHRSDEPLEGDILLDFHIVFIDANYEAVNFFNEVTENETSEISPPKSRTEAPKR